MNLPAAPFRRLPFPLLLAAVGLLFAAVGVAVVDDYGIGPDEIGQRRLAKETLAYVMGGRDSLQDIHGPEHNRYYGLAFELPLYGAERLLGLADSRDIYLLRHLLTHLFFIAGGFFCGLLAWRMFNNRWIALLAMLLFLLHPRLYAHSFFNSKDIPFAVMFVIALYFTHRAFRRDTLGAFVLLGVVVGLAANVRPFALPLLPAVLALRGLDWRQTPGGGNARKRILLTAGVFAAAALLAIYASHPWYWENPLRFIDGLQTLSRHPTVVDNLFRGRIVPADAAPAGYVPVWFGITAPPAALLLGAVGIAAVWWRGFRAPGLAGRQGGLRFLLLALGCFILPVAVVIIWQSHIYNGWRQMYFLWGPFCLLAAAGLHSLPLAGGGRNRLRRMAVYGLAVAGLGAAVYAIMSLHPHQQVYFNLLANRAAPDELEQRYDLDYWQTSYRQGLEYLLGNYPDAALHIHTETAVRGNRQLLPAAERARIAPQREGADFRIHSYMNPLERARAAEQGLAVYERRAYGSAYLTVTAPRLVWGAGAIPGDDVYRAAYRRVTAAAGPEARSDFDVYLHDGALYYVKEDCRPADVAPRVFLHLFPVDDADLPDARREYGFDNRGFDFGWRGGFFDGKCITQEPLPDYPVARIRTGQYTPEAGQHWRADFPVRPPAGSMDGGR